MLSFNYKKVNSVFLYILSTTTTITNTVVATVTVTKKLS